MLDQAWVLVNRGRGILWVVACEYIGVCVNGLKLQKYVHLYFCKSPVRTLAAYRSRARQTYLTFQRR
jgi:hypothetical protein